MRNAPGNLLGGGFPLSQLVTALSQFAQRTVVDRTGLTGDFDVELQWTPEQILGHAAAGRATAPAGRSERSVAFTALQEQLGLKLESTKDSVDVLVIDHVEAPTPD